MMSGRPFAGLPERKRSRAEGAEENRYSEMALGIQLSCYMLHLYVFPGITPMKRTRGSAHPIC